jgi:hypothetical protein
MAFNACAECVMLSVTINCIMLSVSMLSVIMMYDVMLNVVRHSQHFIFFITYEWTQ